LYVVDLLSVRVGARHISRQSLAILRYDPSDGLDYLPILQTGNFDGMNINSRIGDCIGRSPADETAARPAGRTARPAHDGRPW
jgi:hypothetical protein